MKALEKQVDGDHYKNMVIQPIEFCHRNKLGPCESLAIKYISRHQNKHGREDIEKAIHCLQLLLDLEYPVGPVKTDHRPWAVPVDVPTAFKESLSVSEMFQQWREQDKKL